jgi:AcrR family transcriptional regulator
LQLVFLPYCTAKQAFPKMILAGAEEPIKLIIRHKVRIGSGHHFAADVLEENYMAKKDSGTRADTEKPVRARGPNTRLTREDWIAAAMDALVKKSIDGVRVEVLATDLGITKGSFYSYFSSRQELLDAVVETWEKSATTSVIERLEGGGKGAEDRLRTLYRLSTVMVPDTPGGPLELAIRAWSRRDQAVREVVQAVDAQRTRYIAKLFEQIGFAPFDAKVRAAMYYGYVAGRNIFLQSGEQAEQMNVYRAVEELVLGVKAITPAEVPAAPPRRKSGKKE